MISEPANFEPDPAEYEALLQFLYMAPVGLAQTSMNGNIVMMNPLVTQLLMPLSRDGGLSNLFSVLETVAPDLTNLCASFPAANGIVCDAMQLHLHNDADKRGPQVLSLTLLKLDHSRLMAVINDITLQERRARQLRQNDAWLNAVMTSITDYALVSLDRYGLIEGWNESIGRVTGFDISSVGKPYSLFNPVGATTPEQQLDRLREADENGWSLDEGMRLRADGSQFWGSSMISPLSDKLAVDMAGTATSNEPAYCMIIRDITDKRDANEHLHKAIYCDHLTGLSNRRAFFEAAELELTRRKKSPRPLSLVLVDADHFKSINDLHGHPAGDAVLRHLAASMKSVFRQVDVVARVGGEEFAILLPSVDLQEATAIAERLRAHLHQRPTNYEDNLINCTASLGVAAMDQSISQISELMKRADKALYAAKHGGRNRVEYWSA